jgi:hypothetical protein
MSKANQILKLINEVERPRVSRNDMEKEGFHHDSSIEDSNGATLDWYSHPKLKNYKFLIRDDKTGVMIKGKHGIEDTVNSPKAVLHTLQNFIK